MSTPSQHKRAPQASVIDTHERRLAILKDIENDRGTSAQIARRYGISVQAIRQKRAYIIRELVSKTRSDRDLRTAEGIMAKLDTQIEICDQIQTAMKAYLSDPDDPTKIWMGLQAEEVVAHYDEETGEERKDGTPITKRKKSMLSELVKRFESQGKSSFEFTVKRDDTRKLYMDSVKMIGEVLDRFAKIQGLIKGVHVSISRTETWSFVMADIIKATEKYPEAREAIVAMFEEKARELPTE
jgi:hypothetical protein